MFLIITKTGNKYFELIKNLRINIFFFTTNLKLEGETNLDNDVSFINYLRSKTTILWAVHNIFELVAYLSSFDIGSKNIFIYAYHKYHKKNWNTAAYSVTPIDPRKILVGSVVVEIDKNFDKKNEITFHRPSVEILIDGREFFKSPW